MLRLNTVSIILLLLPAACEGRRQEQPVVVENPRTNENSAESSDESPEVNSETASGTESSIENGEIKNPQAETGLSTAEYNRGRTFVNSWSGEQDELPPGSPWHLKSVRGSANATSADSTTPGTSIPPGSNTTTPAVTTDTSPSGQPGFTEFKIAKGTGNGAWNTAATEVVLKVGVKFVIINEDTVTHQWHTNGSPCPHGSPIPPGGRGECTPSQAYNSGALYDHITQGKFYVRATK